MPDLLLELFSEEIPARMQAAAEEHLAVALTGALREAGLAHTGAPRFVTPRRVAVIVKDIPAQQEDATIEKKGPKTSAPQGAIDGFLKSNGLTLDKLEKRMVGKDETYFAVIRQKGQPTSLLLKTIIEKILGNFPWPKSMRWGAGETSWVRPLHSILCLFDGKVVPIAFAGITGGNVTHGHRFLEPLPITITSPESYEETLRKAYVIADREKRRQEILRQAREMAGKEGLALKEDRGLEEEVTGLVEWPTVLMGGIDAKFMDLPPEVLVSEMRAHQKYFSLTPALSQREREKKPSPSGRGLGEGQLAPYFLIVSNMITSDGGKAVVAGNERVLRARLSDGRFFWDQDRKKTLDEWAKGLKGITFHAKIGTMAEKVERLKYLAEELANFVPETNSKFVYRAAELCKADLVTGMVGEFPELQGVMGRYYALHQKEDVRVADAIRDHYLPLGPDSPIPSAPTSICVALADKLDSLISLFTIEEKPTGSRDPYALRRAALGFIRIILGNKIRLEFHKILNRVYLNDFISNLLHYNYLIKHKDYKNVEFNFNKVVGAFRTTFEPVKEGFLPYNVGVIHKHTPIVKSEITHFIFDRLKGMLREEGIRHDVVSAVMAGGDDDLVRVVGRARALQEFLATDDGANLLAAYKRGINILNIEEKKDKRTYEGILSSSAKPRSIEEALNKATPIIECCIKEERFIDAMNELSALRKPVDEFFDKTLINDPDSKIREDNLKILANIKRDFAWIADFSKIEGEAA